MYDSAFSAFGKTWTSRSYATRHVKAKAKHSWFDDKCRAARNDFKWARNTFLKCKDDVNRQNFVSMRSKYNKIKRLAKKKLKIKEGHELCNMAKTNPKLFWKSVKKKNSTNKIQSDNLTTNGLFEHFTSFYGEEPAEMNQHTPNNIPDNTFNTDLDMEISETGLKTAIFSQKMIKALSPIVYVLNY